MLPPKLNILAEYILDTENEDFDENPSKDHILYHALVYKFGKEYADNELENALYSNLNGEGKI